MKKYISLALLVAFMSMNTAMAASNYAYQKNTNEQQMYVQNQPLKGYVVSVPSGQIIPAVTTMALGSDSLTQGQAVNLTLNSGFTYNGRQIAPAGSIAIGTVTTCEKAKHGSINGKLKITFTQITTPQGIVIPINGVIKTSDGSGLLVGGTKADVAKEYVKDAAVGSAAGALSGVVFGALAGGSVGQGAALGTAVGAGGGLVKSAIDKGKDVVIPANSVIDIFLTQPITVNPTAYSYSD